MDISNPLILQEMDKMDIKMDMAFNPVIISLSRLFGGLHVHLWLLGAFIFCFCRFSAWEERSGELKRDIYI
jgi:hypothetical protein